MTFTRTPEEEVVLRTTFVGIVLDEFSGRPPGSALSAELLVEESDGKVPAGVVRVRTGLTAGVTRHGNLYFDGLRPPNPKSTVTRRYHALVAAAGLRPLYPQGADSIAFSLSATQPTAQARITLLPSSDYHYPRHLPVARGVVRNVKDGDGDTPKESVLLSVVGTSDRSLVGPGGSFAVCLRRANPLQPVTIAATSSLGRAASVTYPSPAAAQAKSIAFDLA